MPDKNAENIAFFKKCVDFTAVFIGSGRGFAHEIVFAAVVGVKNIKFIFMVAESPDSAFCEPLDTLDNIKVFGRWDMLKNKRRNEFFLCRFSLVPLRAKP